jgi:serine/threonine-protein kinase RsbW/non-specific serine/threonine protein kinase
MPHRWADFITPSTLQLAPLLEVLLEPISCDQQMASLQLGLQEVLVNAVRHGNRNDPGKCLRVGAR